MRRYLWIGVVGRAEEIRPLLQWCEAGCLQKTAVSEDDAIKFSCVHSHGHGCCYTTVLAIAVVPEPNTHR